MEIGLAFYLNKNIYIWNEVADTAAYREELLAFDVQFVNADLDEIVVKTGFKLHE